jgi:TP901 family phage tail tape measure protein
MSFNAGSIVAKLKMDTNQFTSGMKSAVKGVGIFGAAVTGIAIAALGKATKSANEWQKSLSNVNTLIDTSVVNTQEMAKGLIGLDARLGSTIELTDALYQSFSSGADTLEEAMQVTEDAAKFARAGLTDTATAVDVLTTAQNAYGKEAVSTAAASDIFFTTIKQGKITGEELASSIGQSIPLFASMGIPLEELSAGMAAMTKQGISASESTTQLNSLVSAFLKPSEAMTEALLEQGYASGSALLEAEGLSGALEFLETATGGSTEELANLIPNTRGVRGALALTGQGAEEFASILKEMETAAGATDEAFQKQELTWDTLNNQMEKIELLAGNVGKHFVDKIAVGAISAGTAIVDFINSSRGMEIVSQVVGFAAGAFELIKSGIQILVDNLLPPLNSLWQTVTENLSKVTGESEKGAGAMRLFSWAIEAVSMGLTLIGKVGEIVITSIVDLVIVITKSAQAIGSFFDLITGKVSFSDVKENFKEVGDAFANLGSNFAEGVGELITETKEQFANFSQNVEDTTLEISTNVKKTTQATQDYVISNWDAMLTGQTKFVGQSSELDEEREEDVEEVADNILDIELSLIDKLKAAWNEFFKDAEFSWEGLYDSIASTVDYGIGQIDTLTSLFHENEQAKIDNAKNEQLDALEENFENNLISQEDYEEQKKLIEDKALDESNKIAEKHFQTEKNLNIASAWMNAASSIAGWWAQAPKLGPVAGPIFAGAMTLATLGMAGAQTALISQQEFVPARRFGGMADGLTRVNEAGGEIISLPDGSQVIPNDISRQIGQNAGAGQTNIFNFHNPVVRDDRDIDMIVSKVSRKLGQNLRTA